MDDDGLELLTGARAGDLLGAVLGATGGAVLDWQPRQVHHEPGRRTTVSYTARVRWADGSVTTESVSAASGDLPDGVARLCDGVTEVGLWRFPHDPELPALAVACDPVRMRRLAADLGLGDGPVRLRVRAYRPCRRAVIQLAAPRGTVFVKVVRPSRAAGLHERHRRATAAGCPVPASLGLTDDGLVVLAGLPGDTLRAGLTGPDHVPLDVGSLLGVLDTLPPGLADGRCRTWGQKAGHYAGVLAAAVPELAGRVRAVAAAVDHGDEPEGPAVPVHGDFYESQVMVRDGRVSGLLDIDTAACGERLDDVACLLGHLDVLAELYPGRAAVIGGLAEGVRQRTAHDLDPAALARRTAAVVLSLATGPHRVQEPGWLAATERRVALAERQLATREGSFMDSARSTSSGGAILLVHNRNGATP